MRTAIRSMKRLLVLLPAVMLAACGSDEGRPDPMPATTQTAQEYVVGFGETIRVSGLSLEFTTLAEESRCPTSVTCVWEGNARVLPTGFVPESLPPAVNKDIGFISYRSSTTFKDNVLRYTRTLEVKELSVPLAKVQSLKEFYRVIAGDERNSAVLKRP